MKITTLPVFSKLADEKDIPPEVRAKLPEGWKLSQHQVETYKALTEGDADVIFNTAMTGDGKSLAGQLPILIKGGSYWKTLTMYPTNELIEDQRGNFEKTKALWDVSIYTDILYGLKLDQKMEEDGYSRRGDALMSILKNQDLVLTNPDIFHYVMHQFYRFPKDAPDGYAGQLANIFSQLTFDEFHIFEAPQIVSVLNALLFMHEIGGKANRHKFLFLSATPGELLMKYLKKSGLRVHDEIKGEYATDGDLEHWRRILHQAEVNIESEPRAEAWIDAHLDDIILPFFKERTPNAKGAIIVNSVASAYRICEKLKQRGLNAELNTGLTSRSKRKASYAADLLIGTSTVDVGVDFQINFLVFEGLNGGTFLQRLGRLGRHAGYERDGKKHEFKDYVAYALVPNWIASRLFTPSEENPTPLLVENSTVDRQQFNQAVRDAYPPTADFQHYAHCWGQMQTIRILQGLYSKTVREQYQETRTRLEKRYKETFNTELHYSRFTRLQKDKSPILQEALSFRGGDSFPCCILDEKEPNQWEQFKNTDLLRMIASYNLEALGKDAFYAAVKKAGLKTDSFENRDPLGFFKMLGVGTERQNFKFFLNQNLLGAGENEFGAVRSLAGFELDADFPDKVAINKQLKQKEFVVLLFEGKEPLELKKSFRLPMLFPLYEYYSRDYRCGTVAFGRTALMLESRLKFLPVHSGGGAIIC